VTVLRVDATGRRCPVPVIELAKHLPEIDVDATIELLADDPAAAGDVAAWCRMRGHALVSSADLGGDVTSYVVRRLH
jgi:tRNA 2-thiouridine synthesizing protein A